MFASLLTRLWARPNDAERDRTSRWREKFESFRAEVRARKQREHREREALKAQSMRRLRRVPSVEALRHMMATRLPLAQRRAADVPTELPPPAVDLTRQARRAVVDGLVVWVPAPKTQSSRSIERTLEKLRFPYRTISQTRDVAIGGIMLDIGANIGRMALPRVVLGDVTRAFCAEPDPLNYECLVANIRDNKLSGLVVPDRVAISDRIGEVQWQLGKMPGSHRVDYSSAGTRGAATVPSTTLDAWVEQHRIPLSEITLVKVDTQGSEVHVLSGASSVLAQRQIAWQIEIAPAHLRLAGTGAPELYRILADRFTHFFDLNPEGTGPRLRPVTELTAALDYLERTEFAQTDIVVYRAAG
jgi:FkbM family methyltransferase